MGELEAEFDILHVGRDSNREADELAKREAYGDDY